MEEVKAFKSEDGKLFTTKLACLIHEVKVYSTDVHGKMSGTIIMQNRRKLVELHYEIDLILSGSSDAVADI